MDAQFNIDLEAVQPMSRLEEKFCHLPIARTFRIFLMAGMAIAFTLTVVASWVFVGGVFSKMVADLLGAGISDVYEDVLDKSDESILSVAHEVAADLEGLDDYSEESLNALSEAHHVTEINVVDEEGVIIATNYPEFLGYDMASGEQSAEFLVLLSGQEEYAQEYQPIAYDSEQTRKYAGVALEGGGFVEIGYDAERFQEDLAQQVGEVTTNRHVGEQGYLIVSNRHGVIVSCAEGSVGSSLSSIGLDLGNGKTEEKIFSSTVSDVPSYCMYREIEGYSVIGIMPKEATSGVFYLVMALMTASQLLIFIVLFSMANRLLKDLVVDSVHKLNTSLGRISNGHLDEVADARTAREFRELSDDINYTVESLKGLIAEAEARIDRELDYARQIQFAALPKTFPPFPDKVDQIDLFASTTPAKEVGGDFYDMVALSGNRVAFLVADVSDKGIPAALFMMRSKELIKGHMLTGMDVAEAFSLANDELAQDNHTNMFVTAWMGVLDLKTGLLEFVNAGHDAPVLRRGSEEFAFMKMKPGFVLAGIEGMRYQKSTLVLEPGDELFLYTDGVIDAQNEDGERFGSEQLLATLAASKAGTAHGRCKDVEQAIAAFVKDEEPFDDITMLSFIYKNRAVSDNQEGLSMKELTIDATIENIPVVTDFVDEELEAQGCPIRARMQIDIAIDEILSNIAQYAYCPETGPATIRVEVGGDPLEVVVTFIDGGVPYDPLALGDPDVTASFEDREIGGLGIFLVKQTMDDVVYEYRDGRNILRIKKRIEE